MIHLFAPKKGAFAIEPSHSNHHGDDSMIELMDRKDQMLVDMERNKILQSLSSGGKPDSASECSSARRRIIYDFKWPFIALVILLGAAASATVLLVGISGVHHDSEQAFLHEASQLASVMEFSWRGYETLALWVHESCHFNPAHTAVFPWRCRP